MIDLADDLSKSPCHVERSRNTVRHGGIDKIGAPFDYAQDDNGSGFRKDLANDLSKSPCHVERS